MQLDTLNPLLVTGNREFDRAHQAMIAETRRVQALPPGSFADPCLALFDAIERDFRAEERVMEDIAYPGEATHREQHARALSGLHHAGAALMHGDPGPARRCLELLPDWLALHVETQDEPLVLALSLNSTPT
jgi:hemerythrin-like metal-binding protein